MSKKDPFVEPTEKQEAANKVFDEIRESSIEYRYIDQWCEANRPVNPTKEESQEYLQNFLKALKAVYD